MLPKATPTSPGHRDLTRLIEAAGGVVLDDEEDTDFTYLIVPQAKGQRPATATTPAQVTCAWILDSISKGELEPIQSRDQEEEDGNMSEEM